MISKNKEMDSPEKVMKKEAIFTNGLFHIPLIPRQSLILHQ
jgi:hypothetical protein